MPHTRVWMVFVVLGLAFGSSVAPAQTAPPPGHHKIPKKQAELPPLPAGPLSPVPMDQIPPAPPHVSYQLGLLTIVAENSTLADILLDVRKLTGASIDVPPNASERVVARLGPGPPRDVLAGLLNGTSFNYVMVGSRSDPTALSALVLTAKTAGGPDGAITASTPTYTPPPVAMVEQLAPSFPPARIQRPVGAPAGNPAVAEADDSDSDDDNDDDDQAAGETPAQAPVREPTPEQLQKMQDKLGPLSGTTPPPPFTPPNPATPPH